MKSNNKFPRGVLALITIAVLAILVWRLAPSNFFYPSVVIACLLAIGIILLIYRSPRTASTDNSRPGKGEDTNEANSLQEALGTGDLAVEAASPGAGFSSRSTGRPLSGFRSMADRPLATEVAARYMRMAALARAEEEERNTWKPRPKAVETIVDEQTTEAVATDKVAAPTVDGDSPAAEPNSV